MLHYVVAFPQASAPGTGHASAMITTNKTGTLNTKAVTASQLAQNSPLLPHKMSGQYYSVGDSSRTEPPALPPRGVPRPLSRDGSREGGGLFRENSLGSKPVPPAVPPKRSSLTRSDLALFDSASVSSQQKQQDFVIILICTPFQSRTNSLPRRDPRQNIRSRDYSLTRGSTGLSTGGSSFLQGSTNSMAGHPSWTDSLPRRDFYSIGQHATGSLPRRDKAGLGRLDPGSQVPAGPGPGITLNGQLKRDLPLLSKGN